MLIYTMVSQIKKNFKEIATFFFTLLIVIGFPIESNASVVVIPGTGGANISADKAANTSTPAYTTLLGKIYITEGAATDFAANQSGVTLILSAPPNWTFNPGVGTVSKTSHGSFTGNTSIVVTANTITITFSTSADTTNKDTLIISSIAVESSNGALLPNAGNITWTGGTASINGISSSINFGSLSQVAGTCTHFVINPDANNNSFIHSPQKTAVAFSLSIYAQDQFNHTATTFVSAATLTVNGGAINPATSGNFAAGVKTFTPSLSPIGNGRIITATNGTKTGVSNAITVNSDGLTPQGSLAGGTLCNGGTGQLKWTSTYGTGPFTVVYSNGSAINTATGVVSGTPFNVSPNPTSTTTYTLISVADNNSNFRNYGFTAGSATITVYPRPTSVLSGSNTICKGGAANLTIQFTGTAPFTYKINSGTAINTSTNPLTVSEAPTTTTSYTVTNLNDAHCTSISTDMTGSATVAVNVPSVVTSATLHATSTTLCNSGTQTSTLTQTTGTLGTSAYWQWYTNSTFTNPVGGQLSSTNASIVVSPTATTTYYLRAEGNVAPCPANDPVSGSLTITVNQPSNGGTITNATPCNTSGTLTLAGYVGAIQKWQSSTSQSFNTITNITNTTTSQTYNTTAITYYRTVVTNGVCSSAYSSPITVNDTTRPTWSTAPGGLNTTVGCSDANGLATAQALVPAVNDDFSQALTYVKTSGSFISAGGLCAQTGTYTNTWTVSDVCHYAARSSFSQTITIIDNTSPTWTTSAGALDQTISCDNTIALASAQLLVPTATDACAGTSTPVKISGSFVPTNSNCSQGGTYTNTWTSTNTCNGNISAPFTQTITIVDQTPPVWVTAAGALDQTVECNDANGLAVAQALVPTASDNCTSSMTPVKTSGSFVSNGGNCPQTGTYTNTFTVTDGCGNYTTSAFTQTITVIDNIPPVWVSQAGSLDRLVACSDSADLAAAQALVPTASDNCSQILTPVKTAGAYTPSNTAPETGTYTNTFTVSDGCGNTSTSVFTQTITINPSGPSSNLCPVYYDRAVRMAATTSNLFLQAIFDWDNQPANAAACPNCETNNLLKYLQNNHINKIIIDGIAYHSPNGCGAGPLGMAYGNVYPAQLSNFITNAKNNYGVTKVLAGLHEAPEVLNGDILGSKADINAIVAYNNNPAHTGKIDQFWIDYEFWNAGANEYCINCPISNPCNVPYFANSSNYVDSHGRNFTEFGFMQFKALIAYADSQRLNTSNMQKSEVLITPNISFNISEAYPPYHIGADSINGRYVFDTTGGTLTQGLAFADWLENSSHNIGAIAIDLTGADNRSTSVNPQTCFTGHVHDLHGCNSYTPDHFLNVDVDNASDDISPCTDPWDPNHFVTNNDGGFRQRCMDFLGSFGNGTIPICPYFSAESLTFNTVNALSNYMTADVCANNNPAYGGVCSNSRVHYIPQIDSTFMAQYQNSWKESFVQGYSNSPYQLYSDPVYSNLNFNHQQSTQSPWWGALNSIVLGSVEYFPMNTYPFVLDNVPCHGYHLTNHINAFNATSYPGPNQPPFMYIPQDRSGDGAPDYYVACNNNHRMTNGNSMNPKAAPQLTFSAAIYPNPSDGNFIMVYQLPTGKGTLTITDFTGREVYHQILIGITDSQNINLTNLRGGIYFWEIISSDNASSKGKIVVMK